MSPIDVSIVIPCYNVEHFIADAIDSVFRQRTTRRIEVICVDNGSSDGTKRILEGVAVRHPLHILDEKKRGACAARNTGLRKAQGTWVQFLDADDLLDAAKIESQIAYSLQNGRVNLAGAYSRLAINGRVSDHYPEQDPWKGLFNTRFGITSSLMLLREEVLRVGGWNEDLASSQEYDLMFRMMVAGSAFTAHQEILTTVRDRAAGQISQSDPGPRWEQYLALRIQIMKYLENSEPQYFKEHLGYFRQSFFDLVRTAYLYAPEVAVPFYEAVLGPKFRPMVSAVSGRPYLLLHRLVGFPMADKLKRMLSLR